MHPVAPPPEAPLDEAVIEAAATRPPMFLGLPLRLSSVLVCVGALLLILTDSFKWQFGIAVGMGMVWGAAKALVARDLHGFDVWLVHAVTDGLALDRPEWGGARPASLSLRPGAPYGVFADAV